MHPGSTVANRSPFLTACNSVGVHDPKNNFGHDRNGTWAKLVSVTPTLRLHYRFWTYEHFRPFYKRFRPFRTVWNILKITFMVRWRFTFQYREQHCICCNFFCKFLFSYFLCSIWIISDSNFCVTHSIKDFTLYWWINFL